MCAQRRCYLPTICLLLVASAPMVEAQEIASSFDQLRVLLKRGDSVTVTDRSGREITGRIADLSFSSLVLLVISRSTCSTRSTARRNALVSIGRRSSSCVLPTRLRRRPRDNRVELMMRAGCGSGETHRPDEPPSPFTENPCGFRKF